MKIEHECEKIKLNTLIDLSDKYTSINKIVIDYVKTNLSEVNFNELYNKLLLNTEFNILEHNINSECVTGWIDRMVLVHSNYRIFNKELNTQWFCGFINNIAIITTVFIFVNVALIFARVVIIVFIKFKFFFCSI